MAVNPMDMTKCNRCGMCEYFCPMDVIRFDKIKKEPYIAYIQECMICGLCENRCPSGAISLSPEKNIQLMVSWR